MNSETTQQSFSDYIIPFLDSTGYRNNMVLLDNAACHISTSTLNFFEKNDVSVFPSGSKRCNSTHGYPSNSCDMNPIELVYSYWSQKVAERRCTTTRSLIRAIHQEWDKIPMKIIRDIISSQGKRIKWIADNNGQQYKSH